MAIVDLTRERTLGGLVKAIRSARGWTLKRMSEVGGIPLSTLAKVESDQLSLSYDKIQMLARKLGMSMADFLGQSDGSGAGAKPMTARRSLTDAGNSVSIETNSYRHEYLFSDLTRKSMVPILTEVKARSLEEFGDPVSHPGEEFIYVLEGAIQVHLEFYAPAIIRQGQGIYIDSQMRHCYLLHECDRAVILAVCSDDDRDLEKALFDLAEAGRKAS